MKQILTVTITEKEIQRNFLVLNFVYITMLIKKIRKQRSNGLVLLN